MSDLTFWAWFYTCAGSLVLAFAVALFLSSGTDAPTGRHRAGAPRPIRVELDGLRAPSYSRRERVPFPVATPGPVPAPARLPEPERTPPVSPTLQEVTADAIEREQRAHRAPKLDPAVLPRPATVRVVPLWVRRWEADAEAQRQAARLAALWAIAEGLPDPGYSYPGAHRLVGAVA
ncbi:hypothetical protein [Streptomyces sp. NRRL B-24484]|uniref:hypothetical protein n=1 Tax=Streptomyces sp. NRRL B-24484 TaxID=1463833 RepID=UPI0005BCF2AC|nr:hypothetical protein [Streptomyces sp. NRRL B-24484]